MNILIGIGSVIVALALVAAYLLGIGWVIMTVLAAFDVEISLLVGAGIALLAGIVFGGSTR